MATLDGLEEIMAEQAPAQTEAEAKAVPVEESAAPETTTTKPSNSGFLAAVTKLKLSPQDRNSFLQAIAFNANNYRTAFRNETGRVLYQRLHGEEFTTDVINLNLEFIQENAIFPEFNFFVQPSLATADSKALLLLSNGLYVRGVFGRPNVDAELDPMNPSYYIDVKDENGEIVQEPCGLSAIVAINTRFDFEKVPVITKDQYVSTPVKLVYDSIENAKRYRMAPAITEANRLKEAEKKRRRAKSSQARKARKANR